MLSMSKFNLKSCWLERIYVFWIIKNKFKFLMIFYLILSKLFQFIHLFWSKKKFKNKKIHFYTYGLKMGLSLKCYMMYLKLTESVESSIYSPSIAHLYHLVSLCFENYNKFCSFFRTRKQPNVGGNRMGYRVGYRGGIAGQ